MLLVSSDDRNPIVDNHQGFLQLPCSVDSQGKNGVKTQVRNPTST